MISHQTMAHKTFKDSKSKFKAHQAVAHDGAGVADPMMRERRERRVEKERGKGCVCAGGKRKKMKRVKEGHG